MKLKVFTAIALAAMLLTSCSKNPAEKYISILNDVKEEIEAVNTMEEFEALDEKYDSEITAVKEAFDKWTEENPDEAKQYQDTLLAAETAVQKAVQEAMLGLLLTGGDMTEAKEKAEEQAKDEE